MTQQATNAVKLKRHRSGEINLRKAAEGEPCLIRLPGCDGGGATTVLAHFRLAGLCGTALKPPDVCGAFACARCHAAVDGVRRIDGYNRDQIRLAHAEGCLRTAVRVLEMEGRS